MEYKYLISEVTNPYYNLAMEHYLFKKVEKGVVILFLWQNDNTIVIGRNQEAETECRINEFLSEDGKIARRHSGGGAVYHDLGNLNYSIISKKEEVEECRYQKIVKDALRVFGLFAKYNGRNDLLVQGKKFSGNAFYDNGDVICQHGTLLIASDIGRMTRLLTPEKEKLERNRVHSVASRVINLTEVLQGLTVGNLEEAIIKTVGAEALNLCVDKCEIEHLTSCYADKNWIFGRNFG